MRKFMFNSNNNTLYINTDIIMCDTSNMNFKERVVAMKKHFTLSMQERINLSNYKKEILEEIAKHQNCKLSEFTDL